MFDIWTVCTINYLNVTVFEFDNHASCLLDGTFLDYVDTCFKVYLQRIGSFRK